jgi:glycosyltransferase involved in cell wall biosynthesis
MSLISVVMPVLNAGPWLKESIDSILAQSHDELELIVVDDGSSDDSREVAAEAAARDPRVTRLDLDPLPGNTSSARAANAGIGIARGAYIARMDADDVALPERLQRQLAFLEVHDLDACGTLAQAFGSEDRLYWYPESRDGIGRELLFRVGILHPTLLARAKLMHDQPYLTSASHEDYEWQTRVWAAGARLGNVQEVLLRHRTHLDQAHVRHAALFGRDLRAYRFRHLMRLFPRTRPDEYQSLAAIAEKAEISGADELAAAADWLARLADVEEEAESVAMGRRWDQICDRAGLDPGDPLRALYAKAVAARRTG